MPGQKIEFLFYKKNISGIVNFVLFKFVFGAMIGRQYELKHLQPDEGKNYSFFVQRDSEKMRKIEPRPMFYNEVYPACLAVSEYV